MIQKSLSLIESVSLCVFLLPPLVQPSALWLSSVPTLLHERIACVMLHASVFSSSSLLRGAAVFTDSSHTLSAASSVAFPLSRFLVLVFYVTNFLDKCSYHGLHGSEDALSLIISVTVRTRAGHCQAARPPMFLAGRRAD